MADIVESQLPQTQEFSHEWEDHNDAKASWGRLVPLVKDFREVDLSYEKDTYTFGRGRNCDVRMANIHISTHHCKIYRQNSKTKHTRPTVYIVDSSANGTFVNKTRLKKGEPRQLTPGDTVSLVTPNNKSSKEGFASFIFLQVPPSKDEVQARADATTTRNIFDLYEVYEEVGNGVSSVVRRGVKKDTGANVAVKIIEKKRFKLSGSFQMDSLLREVEVLRKLNHPAIISLQDIFQTTDALYIVTDFVKGGELFDRLVNEGPYPEPRAKVLTRRLFEAIKHMHDRNIVHRDLKPENLLLRDDTDDTDVMVADFGVAKTLGLEGLKTFCGSPQYFAPEVLRRADTVLGQGRYGKGADMWSLGVILFIILSGCPPFDERTLERKKESVPYNFSLPVWRSVSGSAKELIRGLLNPNADDRLTIDEALNHPWLADVHVTYPGRSSTVVTQEAKSKSSTDIADDELEDPVPATAAAAAAAAMAKGAGAGAGAASAAARTKRRAPDDSSGSDDAPDDGAAKRGRGHHQ